MSLTVAQIDDLVSLTLEQYPSKQLVDLASTYQSYEFLKRLLNEKRTVEQGGDAIKWHLRVNKTDAARNVGLYEKDVVNVRNVTVSAEIAWAHTEVYWGYEIKEGLINAGPKQIVNLVKEREDGAMIDLVEHTEEDFWGSPDSSSDDKTPYGVPFWIQKNPSEGFNGGDPSGFSSGAAGVATATYPGWKNYTAAYTVVSADDLVEKMVRGHMETNWQSPVDADEMRNGIGRDLRYYTNRDVMISLSKLIRAQNDNLGADLAAMEGVQTFMKHPIVYVPYLNSDTSNPIYGVDFRFFKIVVLKGDNMRRTGPVPAPDSHDTRVVWINLSWNTRCENRRTQQVFYVA